MSALLPIINRLILQSPDSRSELRLCRQNTDPEHCRAETGGTHHGRRFVSAETACRHRNYLPQQRGTENPQGGEPGAGDIGLEGDLILGIAVLSLLGSLRSRASDELARIFGTQADISSRTADIGHGIKQIGRNIAEQINGLYSEYESANIGNEALADCLEGNKHDYATAWNASTNALDRLETRHLDRLTFRRHPT